MPTLDEQLDSLVSAAETGEDLPPAEYNVDEVHQENNVETEEEPPAPEETHEEPPAEPETPVEEEQPDEEEPPADDKTKKVEKPVEESEEDKALTKLLEEHGVKAPAKGQRVNNIPYPRVRKIVANAIKRETERVSKANETLVSEHGVFKAENENYRRAEELAMQDPDKYIQVLALHNPAYKKFLEPKASPEQAEAAAKAMNLPDVKDDPKPEPDMRFSDGSTGYSEDQHAKLLAWAGRQGAREVLKSVEGRLAPIEKERTEAAKAKAAEEARGRQLQVMRADIQVLRQTFGDLFTADEKLAEAGKSEIIAYQKAHRGVSLVQAALAVLVPKIQKSESDIRLDERKRYQDELKKRKAAARPAPAATKKPADAPVSLDDAIDQELQKHGL